MRLALLSALLFLPCAALAQTNTPSATAPAPSKPASSTRLSRTAMTAAELQKTVDQLTKSNADLLDLLKQQQSVLEDIQFDRRQQGRHIESLEERLEEALLQNTQLQNKIANLEAEAAVRPSGPPLPSPAANPADTNAPPIQAQAEPVAETPPPPPATYLPAPDAEGPPGTPSWHRLFTLKGADGQNSDLFHIQGKTWRVFWHNQDPPGKTYQNTSALFINAFPKDDTIPQKVCAKVGSGGDSTELVGPGNYYLKIEASGGSWELAVEDFR